MAHILVLDDRPLNREFMTTLLAYCGHTVAEANDGVEGLERVRERRPDLVITDILMPNMDGEEFTRRLRSAPQTRDVPVIIYTATYRAREARAVADRVQVRQVLAKPCEPKTILAAVAEALGTAAAETPARPAGKVAAAPEPAHPDEGVSERLNTVQALNLRLGQLLENALRLADQQAASLTAMRAIESALQNVQSLGLRLTGLVELGLDLSRARDPQELVELFCRALQDILSARYAGVVISGDPGGRRGSSRAGAWTRRPAPA